jgi:hypothetical protein
MTAWRCTSCLEPVTLAAAISHYRTCTDPEPDDTNTDDNTDEMEN